MHRAPPSLLIAACAVVLLGNEECGATLPEADAVVSSEPAAVARLRAEHPVILQMLAEVEAQAERIHLPLDSAPARRLHDLPSAVPGVEVVRAASFRLDDPTSEARCGEGKAGPTFLLDVEVRAPKRRKPPVARQWAISTCDQGDDTIGNPAFVGAEAAPEHDAGRLGWIFQDVMQAIFDDYHAYIEDFRQERAVILRARMGCPEGADYTRLSTEPDRHGCVRGGVLHGPYAEGDLSPLLEGTRRIEGAFQDGRRHGRWVVRDAAGAVVEERDWIDGELQPPPAPPKKPRR